MKVHRFRQLRFSDIGTYVSASIPSEGCDLQGWIKRLDPPQLIFSDGSVKEFAGFVVKVVNPPPVPEGLPYFDIPMHWDEIDGHPVSDWKEEVANGDTRLGYLEWAENRIGLEIITR